MFLKTVGYMMSPDLSYMMSPDLNYMMNSDLSYKTRGQYFVRSCLSAEC